MTDLPNDQVVPQIISEIVQIESDVVAIAATMVLKNGTIRTLNAFMEGTKLPCWRECRSTKTICAE